MDLLPLALAAALDLATSTPLTEAGRKTQRALYKLTMNTKATIKTFQLAHKLKEQANCKAISIFMNFIQIKLQ